ncbi:MAG: hypothetical protein V4727_05395 [Verrucomicrobiota bacterium]
MARRKSNDEQGVSMDSLMDALTNVVAVLIVILILLQVDVGQTVERMLNELEPATPEQIELALQEKQKVMEQISKQQELLKAPEPTPQEIGAIQADLSILEASLKNNEMSLMEISALRKKVEEQKTIESAEKTKTDAILAEIARIKAQIDQTPIPKAPEATVVRIPNSRDIPESAQIFYCFIQQDQALLVDAIEGKELIMAEMKRHERTLIHSVKKVPKKPDVTTYDQEKVVSHFKQRDLKIRNLNLTVPYNKPRTYLHMRITFDPKKGDASLADMEQPKGRFHKVCEFVRNTPRSVIIFKVHPNGFATYLKAREIADDMNIPCGWEIDTNNAYQERLDFRVNNLEEPPPQTTPAKPNPTPKRKLD